MKAVQYLVTAVVLILGIVASACSQSGSGIPRMDLGKKPAPQFSLADQNGKTLALSDLRGRVVALTYLYTSCPDVCPIVTTVFGEAHDKLGADARKVAFVAVSVDPERDTLPRVRQFLEAQGLQDKMLFLTGDRSDLEPVWASYLVGVAKGNPQGGPDGFYYVTHSNLLHLIDAEGRERYMLKTLDFTAEQLLAELRPLIAEVR